MCASGDILSFTGSVLSALLGACVGGLVTFRAQKKGWEAEASLRDEAWAREAEEGKQARLAAMEAKEAQDRASMMLAVFHLIEIHDFLSKKANAVALANESYGLGVRPVLVGDAGYWQHLPPDAVIPVPEKLAREVQVVLSTRKLHDLSSRLADVDGIYFTATTLWRDYGQAKASFGERVAHLTAADGSLLCLRNDPALQPAMASILRMASYAQMIRERMEVDAAYVKETLLELASSIEGVGGPAVELSFLTADGA